MYSFIVVKNYTHPDVQENSAPDRSDPLTGYIPGLDGLRAISILIVIISHWGYAKFVPGGVGVAIFFAISGFLITTLLLNESSRSGRIDVSKFYIRRLLRLYPELSAFTAVALVVGAAYGLKATPVEIFGVPLYYMNYYYAFGFDYANNEGYPWRHLWSLAVEEHFYIFFPFLATAFLPDRKKFAIAIGLLILLPLMHRIIAHHVIGMPVDYNYVATEARIDSIAWGCLLALMLRQSLDKHGDIARAPYINPWVLGIGLAAFLFALFYRDESFRWTWRFTVIGGALFLIFANLLFDTRWRVALRFLEAPPLRYIGRISYALYLYHLLVSLIVLKCLPIDHLAFLPICFVVSVILAGISFRTIEMPLKPLRRKFGSHLR